MARRALIRSLGDVDIRLLRVFRTVVDCGGLAASELELNIGRSTISKHLSDLETRLDMRLCIRGSAGFSVTSEGQFVLDAADDLLSSIDIFQNRVNDAHENLAGTVRLAAMDHSSSNPNAHIPETFQRFNDLAPAVKFAFSIEPPTVIEAAVIDGRLDLGIVPLHRKSSVLHYQELYSESMFLYCGQGHPLFGSPQLSHIVEDLAHQKYAGFGFNSPNMIAGRRLNLRRSALVQDEEALTVLILSGRYIGFLPDHFATPFVKAGRLSVIAPEQTKYETVMSAIYRKHPVPIRTVTEFLKCLRKTHGTIGSGLLPAPE